MANNKNFVAKNGLSTQNISFVDSTTTETTAIYTTMLDTGTLSFSGSTGQLFSITDSQTGTIFAVNDISGVPSIEVEDSGLIKLDPQDFGNILIGTSIDDGSSKLQVNGSINFTGDLKINGDSGTSGYVLTSQGSGSAPAWTAQGSGGGLSADTLDGLDSTQFLRSDADDTATGKILFQNGGAAGGISTVPSIELGVNTTKSGAVKLHGTTASSFGLIHQSTNNLHIDSVGGSTYLNFYDGNAVLFGNGASGVVAVMGPDGDLWKGTADNTGSRYLTTADEGTGNGLDADTVDTKHATDFTLDYVTGNGNTTTNAMTVGNLDVGTITTGAKLKVEDRINAALGTSADAQFRVVGGATNAHTTHISVSATETAIWDNNSSVSMTFGTANTERMRISNTGNVGIGTGTTTPETKLHLYEAAASPTLLTLHNYQIDIDATGGLGHGNFIDFKMTDDNATFTPQVRIGMLVKDSGGDGGITSEGNGNFVVYTGDGTDALGNGTLTEKLRVTDIGNVGIGTSAPSSLLNISGSAWDNATGGDVRIENSNVVGSSITLAPTASTSYSAGWSLYAAAASGAIGDGSIGFWNHTSSAWKFKIDQNGYSYQTRAYIDSTRGIGPVTGSYGNVQTVGEGVGSYEGYSIAGRLVFMENGSGTGGIYDDSNNIWKIRTDVGTGGVGLYYNTQPVVNTTAGGLAITPASTTTAELLLDSGGHANIIMDRASTSYDNNLLFRTAGGLKWRIWQGDADNALAIRNEVAATDVVTFTDINSTFAGNITTGAGSTDTYTRSYYSDGSYSELRGYGIQISRSTAYLRPTTDGTATLNIGSTGASWNTINYTASVEHNFNNDVSVNGLLTATTKSFTIDHPTQEGKKLRYGSLEGPENGVYVRGRLQGNVIELPEHWTGLVHEDSITVQLTPNGKFQKLYVQEINNNKVYIKNGSWFSNKIDCFYNVYGERKDVDKLEVEFDA